MVIFKTCTLCQKTWLSAKDFLDDKEIKVIGYQSCFQKADEGRYLFIHNRNNCHTSLLLEVKTFAHLIPNENFSCGFSPLGQNCEELCIHEKNLNECKNAACSGYKVRLLLQKIRYWQKK